MYSNKSTVPNAVESSSGNSNCFSLSSIFSSTNQTHRKESEKRFQLELEGKAYQNRIEVINQAKEAFTAITRETMEAVKIHQQKHVNKNDSMLGETTQISDNELPPDILDIRIRLKSFFSDIASEEMPASDRNISEILDNIKRIEEQTENIKQLSTEIAQLCDLANKEINQSLSTFRI